MSRNLLSLLPAIAWILLLTACQGNPVTPGATGTSQQVGVARNASQPHNMGGMYLVEFNTGTGKVNCVEARTASWHLNLTGVINATFGLGVAGVPSEYDPANGIYTFDITLKHPFESQPRFSGFDVKGILLAPGTWEFAGLMFQDDDETRLLNADGYTRWWNPSEFSGNGVFGYIEGKFANASVGELTANINPYKQFADCLGTNADVDTLVDFELDSELGRGVFKSGQDNTRRYRIRFPMTPDLVIRFGYAVDCSWAKSDPWPPEQVPDDFPIVANQPEPFHVTFEPQINTLYYNPSTSGSGGMLRMLVEVYDWQGLADGVIEDEVSNVEVWIPDMAGCYAHAVFDSEDGTCASFIADMSALVTISSVITEKAVCRVTSADGSTYKQGAQPAPEEALSIFDFTTIEIAEQISVCPPDLNNNFNEAEEIGLEDTSNGQVCLPADAADYFYFTGPAGNYMNGDILLYCDDNQTSLSLYDESEVLLDEATADGGLATLTVSGAYPGTCYLKVETACETDIVLYGLETDISLLNVEPNDPVDITNTGLYLDPEFIFTHGNYAFMVGNDIWVYNISEPSNPVRVFEGHINGADTMPVNSAAFNYPYMYTGNTHGSVSVYDFTSPTAPIGTTNIVQVDGSVLGICFSSTRLYVAYLDVGFAVKIAIFDKTTPTAPTFLADFDAPPFTASLAVADPEGPDMRLIVTSLNGVYAYNVDDPESVSASGIYLFDTGSPIYADVVGTDVYVLGLTGDNEGVLQVLSLVMGLLGERGSVSLTGTPMYIDVSGSNAYIGDYSEGLTVVDVTDLDNPVFKSTKPMVSEGHRVSGLGSYAYIIPRFQGFQIVDCSDPANPGTVFRSRVVNSSSVLAEKDGYVLANDSSLAIKAINVSDPANPWVAGEYFIDGGAEGMAIDGNLMISFADDSWIVSDVTDPTSIGYLTTVTETTDITSVAIRDGAAYVGLSDDPIEIRVYSLASPSSPSYSTSLTEDDWVKGFTFEGDYMYMTMGSGVGIYSVTDPLNPFTITDYPEDYHTYHESLALGDYLYIMADERFDVVDISDPENPSEVGNYDLQFEIPGPPFTDIVVEGMYAYCIGSMEGFVPIRIYPTVPLTPVGGGTLWSSINWNAYDAVVLSGHLYVASPDRGLWAYDLY